MIVLILERVPPSLRGELSKWLVEPKVGVFVGRVSGMVRDRLWEKACESMRGGAGILIHQSDAEQGYAIRFWGDTGRLVEDFEGLALIKIPN